MYFIPVRNRLYSFGIKVPPWQRYLLTLCVLFLLALVWYFFVTTSLSARITQTKTSIAQLHNKQNVLDVTTKSLAQTQSIVASQQKEFHQLTKDATVQDMQLLEIAKKSGLSITSYAPENSVDHGWYTATTINCNFSGSFDQICSFLTLCSHENYLFGISSCSITKREHDLQCICAVQLLSIKESTRDEKK